jgi:hypothetical protein
LRRKARGRSKTAAGAGDDVGEGAAQYRSAHHHRQSPGQKAMRGIAEIALVFVDAFPARPQPAGKIAADGGGQHRHRGQVNAGRNGEGGRRNALVGPGRDDGKADANAERDHNQRDGDIGGGAGQNRAPIRRCVCVVDRLNFVSRCHGTQPPYPAEKFTLFAAFNTAQRAWFRL